MANVTADLWTPTQSVFASLGTTYSTASTSDVSTGVGVSVVAQGSGKIKVESSGVTNNSSSNQSTVVSVYESTVGIPAAGSAPGSGDTLIYQSTRTKAAASDNSEFTCHVVRSSLTVGTTYYYYKTLSVGSGGAGTANMLGGNNQSTIVAMQTS